MCAGYESISVLSKHGGLAPLRIGLWKDTTPGKANLGYRCAALLPPPHLPCILICCLLGVSTHESRASSLFMGLAPLPM